MDSCMDSLIDEQREIARCASRFPLETIDAAADAATGAKKMFRDRC